MANAIWLLKVDEKREGPFTAKQVKQLVRSGKIDKQTLIRRVTDTKYVRAEQLKGLFPNSVEIAAPTSKPKQEKGSKKRRRYFALVAGCASIAGLVITAVALFYPGQGTPDKRVDVSAVGQSQIGMVAGGDIGSDSSRDSDSSSQINVEASGNAKVGQVAGGDIINQTDPDVTERQNRELALQVKERISQLDLSVSKVSDKDIFKDAKLTLERGNVLFESDDFSGAHSVWSDALRQYQLALEGDAKVRELEAARLLFDKTVRHAGGADELEQDNPIEWKNIQSSCRSLPSSVAEQKEAWQTATAKVCTLAGPRLKYHAFVAGVKGGEFVGEYSRAFVMHGDSTDLEWHKGWTRDLFAPAQSIDKALWSIGVNKDVGNTLSTYWFEKRAASVVSTFISNLSDDVQKTWGADLQIYHMVGFTVGNYHTVIRSSGSTIDEKSQMKKFAIEALQRLLNDTYIPEDILSEIRKSIQHVQNKHKAPIADLLKEKWRVIR